jgi:hypothetical protein
MRRPVHEARYPSFQTTLRSTNFQKEIYEFYKQAKNIIVCGMSRRKRKSTEQVQARRSKSGRIIRAIPITEFTESDTSRVTPQSLFGKGEWKWLLFLCLLIHHFARTVIAFIISVVRALAAALRGLVFFVVHADVVRPVDEDHVE